ncbi:MAG TPA: MFS transporter [Gammaproteobacteria bacterium]|nr:MFS transporter [Gammaproteobacteria bacterium]
MVKKTLFLLATCQGLMLSCTSLSVASSALVGVALSPNPRLATLPLGLLAVCMMLTMIPASLLMKHYGRRRGFMLGGCAGTIGGLICSLGIIQSSFVIFCAGAAIFGVAMGFGQYYRFAAAEIVDSSYKSRAISWVLAGGLAAAFIGPNTASLTRDLIPNAAFAASYIALAIFSCCIIIIQFFIRIPMPTNDEIEGHQRPMRKVLTQPTFIVAALCAMIAYATMNLLMSATPLAMHARNMPFSDTALVIQWHLVGMFAPSFITGNLIDRFGVLKIMFSGALILISCALIALSGQLYSHFIIGLVMLGIGWNFLYIGGTTLLTEVYSPAEKGSVQGINEFMVFSATSITALSSGYLHYTFGWEKLNLYAIPLICFAATMIALLGWKSRLSQPQVA